MPLVIKGRSTDSLRTGIDMPIRAADPEDIGNPDMNLAWPKLSLPAFDRLYGVLEDGDDIKKLDRPIDTLFLAVVQLDDDHPIPKKKYASAMIIYVGDLGDAGDDAYVELDLDDDENVTPNGAFARIQRADSGEDVGYLGTKHQLRLGDAAWLTNATFGLTPSGGAKSATLLIAGVGGPMTGVCGGRPC